MSSWLLLLLLSWCWSGEGAWGVLQSPTSDLYLVGIDTQDVQPLSFSMVVVFKVIIVAVVMSSGICRLGQKASASDQASVMSC